jgi:hypothetical protein
VQLTSRYPVLGGHLFGTALSRDLPGLIHRLAFAIHENGDSLVKIGLHLAGALETLRLRRRRTSLINALRMFNYWCGVATATGSTAAFRQWIEEESNAPTIALDAPCLEWTSLPTERRRLEALLAEGSRKGLRIHVNGIEALSIPPEPGSESLRIEHVELLLSRACANDIVPALMPASVKALLARSTN